MRILIAPDKYKGTLSAAAVAEAIAEGIRAALPEATIQCLPLADGGEGTAEALTMAMGGEMLTMRAVDARLRPIPCRVGVLPDGKTALLDLAEASGLWRLRPDELDPTRTTTVGTGELIRTLLRKGYRTIYLGLGGSATMDGGAGIVHALGFRLQTDRYEGVSPIGGNLRLATHLDRSRAQLPREPFRLKLLYDVPHTLLGDPGVMTFGKQKGLEEADRDAVEEGLKSLARLVSTTVGKDVSELPGSAAAGGAAICCGGLLDAELLPGAATVMNMTGFESALAEADVLITGEGMLDETTLAGGKLVAEVARMAREQKVPVDAICGQSKVKAAESKKLGLRSVTALFQKDPSADMAQDETKAALVATARAWAEKQLSNAPKTK